MRSAHAWASGLRLPALALQPSDTACSHRRPQLLTCSALLSPEARLQHTPRGPRLLPPPPSPAIPTPHTRPTNRWWRFTPSQHTPPITCGSRGMGFPRRPHRSRQYRPWTTVTWSWPTYGATWQAWTAAPRGLRPLRRRRRGRPRRRRALPPTRSARRRRHCCWHRRGRRSQGRTAGPRHLRSPGRTAGPRHLRSRHAGPRAQPTGGPAPPDGTYAKIAGTTAVQAPVEEAARPTAGPTAPQSGTTGAGPRSAPPSAEPPPLEVETVPPTAGITAPAVARPGRPPGRAGSDEAPTTGAGTAPPARIPLDA